MVHADAESLRGREDVYQWYTAEIKSIPPATRELFEKYSGVPAAQVVPHVSEVVRESLWPITLFSLHMLNSAGTTNSFMKTKLFCFSFCCLANND